MSVIKVARLIAAFGLAAAMFLIRMLALPLRWVAPRWERDIRNALFRITSQGVLRITGIRLTIEGAPPKPPYILVANHTTFFDVFVLASRLGCVFVARSDTEHWPVVGYMVKHLNTIFIDRERMRDTLRVNALIKGALEEGNGVVIFPEGGVSQENRVLPFKAALLQTPADLGMPVHYATLHYETPPGTRPASEVAIWRDGVSFPQHYFGFASLPYVEVTIRFGDAPVLATDRKMLANTLHEKIAADFVPLT
jgi:1-acyl-sn-glycerol-3-phosphate acyltransferase